MPGRPFRHRSAPLLLAGLALGLADAARAADRAPGDPVAGRALYETTAAASGLDGVSSCSDCHGPVENRRAKIAGSAYAAITPARAMSSLARAVSMQPAMQDFRRLGATQAADLAAYLADTPRTSANTLEFAPPALDRPQALSLDLQPAVASEATLAVNAVTIDGGDAASFAIDADACTAQTLAAATPCRVTVSFRAGDTAGKAATLRFALKASNASDAFTREVDLSGAVDTSSPPPPDTPAGLSNEGGGGAMGGGWLIALAAAVAAARTRARPAPARRR